MEEFLEEAFRLEKDLVRLAYWITALEWKRYRPLTQQAAERVEAGAAGLIIELRTLRFQIKEQRE